MIKRKTKRRSSELAELDRASREIESRIQELEASLKRPSQQTRMRLDRNTMPPPDRVREGNQNRALRAVVARDGRATNMRRELRENFMLLGLLICALAASFCWIVRLLEQQKAAPLLIRIFSTLHHEHAPNRRSLHCQAGTH